MMAMGAARKLLGGTVGLVAGAAKHAVWYLRYQAHGETRDDPRRTGRANSSHENA
jgi:hypothetical protein